VTFDHAHDVFLAHHQQLVALHLDGLPGILAEENAVADFDVERNEFAVVIFLALPTATISPWSGFSAAVSGMKMPPADLRSSSTRLTITRSCNGRIFMQSSH
jgi:hypothetical protein